MRTNNQRKITTLIISLINLIKINKREVLKNPFPFSNIDLNQTKRHYTLKHPNVKNELFRH